MTTHVRPGGNNANGGTNETSDALQTLGEAVSRINLSNPDSLDIQLCADTVGGTGIFTGIGNRFLNANQALFPMGTSESQRITIRGRVGDTISLAPPSYIMTFRDVWRYFTLFNLIMDGANATNASDPSLKCFWQVGSRENITQNLIHEVIFQNAPGQALFVSGETQFSTFRNIEFINAARVSGSNSAFYGQGHDCLVEGIIVRWTGTAPGGGSSGFRFYTNNLDVVNGAPGAARNILRGNFVKNANYGMVITGDDIAVYNNIVSKCRLAHLYLYHTANATNDDVRIFNNGFYSQIASNCKGFWWSNGSGAATNVKYTNNIAYAMDVPVDTGGQTLLENLTNLTTDPSWIDPENDDFNIPTGSSAKNVGTTKSEVANDFYGRTRPQGASYDIGPAEFGETVESLLGAGVVNVGALPPLRKIFFMGR